MVREITVNDFLGQVQFRIREHEADFRDAVNAFYSEAGKTGLVGKLRAGLLRDLKERFDAEIQSVLAILGRSIAVSSVDRSELMSHAAAALSQSAIAFKALFDTERLQQFVRGEQFKQQSAAMSREAFKELDELLVLRMQEFALGLHDHSPVFSARKQVDRGQQLGGAPIERAAFPLLGRPHVVPIFCETNREAVKVVVRLLTDFGFDVWDRRIPAGERREEFISRALDETPCAIGFFEGSVSGLLLEELRRANDQNKLLPVMLGGSKLPIGFGDMEPVVVAVDGAISAIESTKLLAATVRISGYHPPIQR